MGLFSRKPRGLSPAEEAARRRAAHIPDPKVAPAATDHRQPAPTVAVPRFETKTVTLSKYSFSKGLTDVPRELEKYVADGWEIVSEDLKKYGRGGKHSILLRRPV
jgi:hypothetical protein